MGSYGYARVSSVSQNLEIQEKALKQAGCEIIRSEKVSGTSTQGRDELKNLMDFLREGDELVVTRVDRLGRSVLDLQTIVKQLQDKQVSLRATEQPIDTSTPVGKCFLDMLSVFAEFETSLRRERQMEGIAKAKEEGRYTGRKSTIDADKVKQLHKDGMGATAIAKELKIGRASVYRMLNA